MRLFAQFVLTIGGFLSLISPVRAQAIAAWHFNEAGGSTAFPAVGAIAGTLSGDAAFIPGGISGNAVSMTTAANGLVDMGNNFALAGNSNHSLVAWVRIANGDTNGYLVTARHQANVIAGYFLGVNNTNSGSGEVTGGGIYYQAYPNPVSTNLGLNDGAWHMLVGVHDVAMNEARLYVDGVRRQTVAINAFTTSAANFAVGGALNSAGSQMIGTLTGAADEVSIWGQALTDAEVTFLFANPGAIVIPEPTSLVFLGGAAVAGWGWRRIRFQAGARQR